MTLSGAVNATLTGGGSTLEVTGTITDNEGVPELELSDVTVTEGTDAEFEVRLGAASGREVTVAYATSDDTAEEPDDYGAESGTLTFGAGDRVKTITVTTEDDELDEADEETFKVTLSGAVNATLSWRRKHAGSDGDDRGQRQCAGVGAVGRDGDRRDRRGV